ncbi:MAG TPA: glycosyl hydrolase 108 family protein, partial [Methylophilaceae bacterium]
MGIFDWAIDFTLLQEGGYSNRANDLGGKTNYGITQSTFISAQNSGLISSSIPGVSSLTLG